MDCILRTPPIRLHEIANYITSATGSSFRPQTMCHAVHMLGMTLTQTLTPTLTLILCGQVFYNCTIVLVVTFVRDCTVKCVPLEMILLLLNVRYYASVNLD